MRVEQRGREGERDQERERGGAVKQREGQEGVRRQSGGDSGEWRGTRPPGEL